MNTISGPKYGLKSHRRYPCAATSSLQDMEASKKFVAQYTRSFFLSKSVLKGARILVILYESIALLLDYIKNWDDGMAFPRDFTALVMLSYFIVCQYHNLSLLKENMAYASYHQTLLTSIIPYTSIPMH